MHERIFKLPADHPGVSHTCHRCNEQIGANVECYLEPEAPASQEDARKMAEGRSYCARARITHVKCSPRAPKPIPEFDEFSRALAFEPF